MTLLIQKANKFERFQRFFLIIFLIAVVLIAAFFSSLPLLIRSQHLESVVKQTIREQMGYETEFQHLRLSFFPAPVLHIEDLKLTPSENNTQLPDIEAERAVFRPSLFSLLQGKPGLAHAGIKHAGIHETWRNKEGLAQSFSLEDVNIDLWNVRPNRPIKIKAKGKFLSDWENFLIDGVVKTDFTNFRISDLESKIRLSLGPIDLNRVEALTRKIPLEIVQGKGSFSVQVLKSKDDPKIEISGDAGLKDLIYKEAKKSIQSTTGSYGLKFKAEADLETGLFDLTDASLTTPFSSQPFDIDAKVDMFRRTIDEILVKCKSLQLDVLPQFILPVQDALPVNLGFSGETQFDLFVKGEPALLSVNPRIDLTQTTLAYSKYFSKPAGIPFFLRGDLKLIGGRLLRGDFSIEFEQAAFKGSLVGIDILSGQGELTILTNKFNIDQWQNYFPPLREVELMGSAKVLMSAKGNFNRPNELSLMNNVTLDKIQIKAKNGAMLRDLNGSIDLGPLDSELKDFSVTIGDSHFSAQGKMFRQPDLRWLVQFSAPSVNVPQTVSELSRLAEVIQIEGANVDLTNLSKSVQGFFPPGESVDSLDGQIAFDHGQFIIPSLQFGVFGGKVTGRGTYDAYSKVPASIFELQIDRINLARMQSAQKNPLFYGNLFAFTEFRSEGAFDPDWINRLKGQGSLAITNGELKTVDILGSLGEVAELSGLASFKSGSTRFNDIRATYTILNQKVQTSDMYLLSDDFQIDGKGEAGFNGDLNFRLNVYLLPSIARKVTANVIENSKLGPIPILITGPIAAPTAKPDPMLVRSFLESFVQGQFSKITERFFPATPRTEEPNPKEAVESQHQKKGKQASLQDELVQSGLGLLDQFLSKKQPSS